MRSKKPPGIADQGTGHLKRGEIASLCAALFGATPLAAPCHTWAVGNPRFADFLATYEGKIGKKLRGSDDDGGYLDLLAELDVAQRLLTDRSFTLVYEPYLAKHQRGPDFGVTFKTHTNFAVEVRHLRPTTANAESRLVAILADKLRQLPAATPNILALKGGTEHIISTEYIQTALNELAALAQRRDDTACRRRGFVDARDLLRRMERLSAVVVLTSLTTSSTAALYEHPRARHTLSVDLRKSLARAFGAA